MQRRRFIKLSAIGTAAALYSRLTYSAAPDTMLMNLPDEVWGQVNDEWLRMSGSGTVFTYHDVRVVVNAEDKLQSVNVESPLKELQAVRLVWRYDTSGYGMVLGDAFERSYGDLGWKAPSPGVRNYWYVLFHDSRQTACFGVKTGAGTLCRWSVNTGSIALTLDTRSGGAGVKLGERVLHAADIVSMMSNPGESAHAAATRFCRVMCDKPRLPKLPVYGINDWYALYGNNSFDKIKNLTAVMAGFVTDTVNRPFSVIDDGWEVSDDFSVPNDKFKDMRLMADVVKGLGMRPGLWTRPLIAKRTDPAVMLAPKIPGRDNASDLILDPTLPETHARISHNLLVYRQWGYEMVKHDYSTYDIFGRWGFQMADGFTAPGWHFNDQSKTNAEIINDLYHTIREAAGDMYVIGCNTLSHLSAGTFELNRTGDDTSGKEWARTRKMGVNTLGFRLPQHNTFYAADGDCAGLTKDVPWDKNRQWLHLLAGSGAPLFISAELGFLGAEQKKVVKAAFAKAAKVQPTGEPLDWLVNDLPKRWLLDGKVTEFNWG